MFRRIAATILALAILAPVGAYLAAPVHAAEPAKSAAVAPLVQTVEVVGTSENITREDVIVTPAPVVEVAQDVPTPILCDAGSVPAWEAGWIGYCWEADMPAVCEGDSIRVEDGSCVPPSFFAEVPPLAVASLPPCVEEDSVENCYWDARVRGNGQGTSFVIVGGVQYLLLP